MEDVQEKNRQLSKELKDAQAQRKKATDEFADLNEKYVHSMTCCRTSCEGLGEI